MAGNESKYPISYAGPWPEEPMAIGKNMSDEFQQKSPDELAGLSGLAARESDASCYPGDVYGRSAAKIISECISGGFKVI